MLQIKWWKSDANEKQLHDFKIMFAYHSGKIENEQISYHDTRDIFDSGQAIWKRFMKWQSKNNALYFWSRTSWIMYSQAGLTTSPAIWSSGKIRNIWKAWSCDRCPWSWCCPCDVEPEWQDLLAEINDHELNDHFLAGVFSRSLWTDPSFCGWKWTRWPNTDEWLFYDPWYRANDDLSWRQARALQVVGSIWCQWGLRPVDQLHWKRTREDMVEDAEKRTKKLASYRSGRDS